MYPFRGSNDDEGCPRRVAVLTWRRRSGSGSPMSPSDGVLGKERSDWRVRAGELRDVIAGTGTGHHQGRAGVGEPPGRRGGEGAAGEEGDTEAERAALACAVGRVTRARNNQPSRGLRGREPVLYFDVKRGSQWENILTRRDRPLRGGFSCRWRKCPLDPV